MPTTNTLTFSLATVEPVANAEDTMSSMQDYPVKASVTLAAGTVVGKVTATGRIAAYASGNADGSQLPIGILRRGAATDASGNITNYDEWGGTGLVIGVYRQGDFLIADLTGLDDNAVTKLGGFVDGNGVANSTILHF